MATSPSAYVNPTTNAGGTRLAAAKPMGTAPAINLTDPNRDTDTLIPGAIAGTWVTIKSALAMGILTRNGATLTENTSPNKAW